MSRTKIVSLVLFVALVLCMGFNKIDGEGNIAPWAYDMNSRCCREHRHLGRCIPKIDDNPEYDGKCWKFCVEGCEKGGFCKLFGHKHVCHCFC
ncbi:hypothetical protein EUTSA_v10026987mg [Eutrema salsugineum]|uniref:Knottin scorpion toxin-like domain-containing protein n=1 Tax=Eutrema salsugineum TaxID=72664 RepID=V4LZU0_EUTSA|nr:defensin-like protein 21 [Eutrema salsugineum]ESQ56200.1 hypothetical protein EUTSA_v10026987mg [Eutrema salsugineum]